MSQIEDTEAYDDTVAQVYQRVIAWEARTFVLRWLLPPTVVQSAQQSLRVGDEQQQIYAEAANCSSRVNKVVLERRPC